MQLGRPPLAHSSGSLRLHQRARAVLPDGNTRHSVFFAPHPVYCDAGEGCRIVDVDGVAYLDFINNYSSLIHGHGHPLVRAAVHDQLDRLVAVGLPTESEIALAELLCRRVASVEQLRFTNSGTEAVMMAIKAARAYSGRSAIAKFEGCYHGTYDAAEVSQAPSPQAWGPADRPASVPMDRGAPPSLTQEVVVLPFNDVEAAERILEANADRLAGVLIDPTPAHLGYLQCSSQMLRLLRGFCDAHGSLLIADEVYALRLDYRGAQYRFGFRPDLTVMGKIIGGGLPIGAVGGSAEIMSVFGLQPHGPAVVHGGTYNANPLSMAAGLASMKALTPDAIAGLEALGEGLRHGLVEAARRRGVEMVVEGLGSIASITFGRGPIRSYRDRALLPDNARLQALFHRAMLDRGILIAPYGLVVLSTPMTSREIETFLEAADGALQALG